MATVDEIGCWYKAGVIALDNENYDLAEALLSKVTSHLSKHAGAWLDLATLYYRSGQKYELRVTLEYIEETFKLPAAIQVVIDSYRNSLMPHVVEDERFVDAMQLEVELGYGNNLNNGSRHDIIHLVGADVVLSESSQPKKGVFTGLTLQALWQCHYDAWVLTPWSVLRNVKYNVVSENDRLLGMLGISAKKQLSSQRILHLTGYHLWTGSSDGRDQRKVWLQGKVKRSLGSRWQLEYWGGGHRERTERQSSSDQYRLGLGLDYLVSRWQWSTSVEWEFEKVQGERNGGDRRGISAKIGMRQFFESGEFASQVRYEIQRDELAYSESLFGSLRKNLRQLRFESSVRLNIQNNQSLMLWGDYIMESSDIDLFETRGWQAGVRWEYNW